MSHFLAPTTANARGPMLAAVRGERMLQAVQRAFRRDMLAATTPMHDARVTNRGLEPARRPVEMSWVGGRMTLPDDGFVWLVGSDLGVDVYERMAPALPELSLSVGRIDAPDGCAAVFALLPGKPPAKPVSGLSPEWVFGPATSGADHRTLSLCRAFPWGMLVAAWSMLRARSTSVQSRRCSRRSPPRPSRRQTSPNAPRGTSYWPTCSRWHAAWRSASRSRSQRASWRRRLAHSSGRSRDR